MTTRKGTTRISSPNDGERKEKESDIFVGDDKDTRILNVKLVARIELKELWYA